MTAGMDSPPDTGPVGASLTEGLAALLARSVDARLPERVVLHVLDWVGCAIIGATTPPGRIVAAWGARLGKGDCHAIGVGRLDAASAAFVNGAYGNVLEMDDIHRTSILHPGPVVIPAALAAADRQAASEREFLDAVVRGYEAVIRVGRSVGPGHYRHWHNTSTCGPFGAAAAVASLLRLGRAQTVSALGNAGTQSSGPWQCRLEGVMSKQLHTAAAARAGLTAADLAALGFTGPARILEGPLGFFAATCPDPDPGAVLADPDAPWLILETSFKPWPACRHAHPTIDATLAVRDRVPIGAIDRIVVTTYADAVTYCDSPAPATPLEAKFSLQHCVASVLLDGPPDLTAFEPPALARTDIGAIRRRVSLAAGDPYVSAYPRHYGAEVSVQLTDGRTIRATVADALGDPENPMSPQAIEAKARMLMRAAGLEAGRIDAIVDHVRALAGGGALSDLTALLP